MESTTHKISLDAIDDPRIAMRTETDDPELDELMADMKVHGLIEPIVVRRTGERFEIIAGHRRARAARLLGWPLIEAKIMDVDDDTAFSLRLAENLQRKDTSPTEEACYVGEVMLRTHKTPEQIAEALHQKLYWVQTRLAVFAMPVYLQEYLRLRRIPLGVALEITQIEREDTRLYYSNWAAQNGCSVAYAHRLRLEANMDKRTAEGAFAAAQAVSSNPQNFIVYSQCAECGGRGAMEEMDQVLVHKTCPLKLEESSLKS